MFKHFFKVNFYFILEHKSTLIIIKLNILKFVLQFKINDLEFKFKKISFILNVKKLIFIVNYLLFS